MKTTRAYPHLDVDTAGVPAVGQAGGVLLTETIAATGLGAELSVALSSWRKPLAVHDPAKVITDLALCLALGGDTLSDVALLRAEPAPSPTPPGRPSGPRWGPAEVLGGGSALGTLSLPLHRCHDHALSV